MPCATNRRRRLARCFGCASLIATAVFAARNASAETVGLARVERQALQRASVIATQYRIAASRAGVDAAVSHYYPTLVAQARGEAAPGSRLVRVRDSEGDEYLVFGSRSLGDSGVLTPDFRYQGGVRLDGELYDFGRRSKGEAAARAALDASNAEAELARQSVLAEVRSAYLDWTAAFGARQIVLGNARNARELRRVDEALVTEGAKPGSEVTTARLDEARADLELERAESVLELARLELESVSGLPLPATAAPDMSVLEPSRSEPVPPSAEAKALEGRRAAAAATAAQHRAARLPSLSANAELGVRGQGSTVFPLYAVGVTLTAPLFDGGGETAAAANADAQAGELAALARGAGDRTRAARKRYFAIAARLSLELSRAERLLAVASEGVAHAETRQDMDGAASRQLLEAKLQRSRAELELLAVRVALARNALLSGEGER